MSVSNPGFMVVGISARTSNAREFAGNGVIAELWQRVMSEGLIERIPSKVDNAIVAVYSNYESDHNGEYDFLIGAKVPTDVVIPDGLMAVRIPPQDYEVVSTDPGLAYQTVPKAWQHVWNTLSDKRTYVADFEIYDERCQNPETAIVDVWIGVRS